MPHRPAAYGCELAVGLGGSPHVPGDWSRHSDLVPLPGHDPAGKLKLVLYEPVLHRLGANAEAADGVGRQRRRRQVALDLGFFRGGRSDGWGPIAAADDSEKNESDFPA